MTSNLHLFIQFIRTSCQTISSKPFDISVILGLSVLSCIWAERDLYGIRRTRLSIFTRLADVGKRTLVGLLGVGALVGTTGLVAAQTAQAETESTTVTAGARDNTGGCSYGQGGPKADALCWIDLSSFGNVSAADLANRSVTKSLEITVGRYIITADAVISAGADGASGVNATALPTWGGAVLGNVINGQHYYTGTSGKPALYQNQDGAISKENSIRDTVTLKNITVKDTKNGNAAVTSGYSLIMADAESTGTGEGFVWSSDKPLNEYQQVVPSNWSTPCTGTYSVLGTPTVKCTSVKNTTSGGRGIIMVSADSPTTMTSSFNNAAYSSSREGVAFAVVFSTAVPGVQVNQKSGSDAEFTTTSSTGGSATSKGDKVTSNEPFLGRSTDTSTTYTVRKSGGNTPEAAYDITWSCTVNGSAVTPVLSPDGKSATVTTPGNGASSCVATATASTLTIRKNLPNGRALTNDQFTLSAAEGTTPLSSTTTKGSASGIQDAELGPMPVVANNTYSFSEAMATGSGSTLSGYTSTWSCIDANNAVVSSGSGSSGSVKIPLVSGKGAAVTCTITNVPLSNGSVTWAKVDENNGPLAGSTWSLVGPTNGTSTTRTVADCVASAASGCSDSLDKDPAAGGFSLTGLPWGNYTLSEKTAPSGYQLDSTTHSFIIDSAATVNVGSFENASIPKATVTIKKVIRKVDGTQTPGSGWKMSANLATGSPSDLAMSGDATSTTNASGTVSTPWTITFANADESASINVGETQQTGYQFLSGSCVTSLNGTSTTTNLNGASASSNLVQGIASGSNVVCTLINEEQPGSVSWSKTAENGAPLAGSEWTITGPGTGSSASKILVKDCVAVGQCAGTNDTDPTPGSFKVANLEWGDYNVQETQAPAGYVTDSATTHDFTISADSLDSSFTVPITNRQQSMPSLPLTGGQSIDSYLIGGSLIMIFSLGIGYAMHRRRAGSVR